METANQVKTVVEPYLCYEGRCEEALNFYKEKLGAEVVALMRFKDSPEEHPCAGQMPDGYKDKVMHSCVKIGESTIMASDGMCSGNASFAGISLSIAVKTEDDADRIFGGLSDGGMVMMPLAKTFFAPKFGMVADKFGVSWMVIVLPEDCGA